VDVIKALVIDDEESAINVVKLLLQKYVPEITTIHTAIGSTQGLQLINEIKPDLLFLDVEMPLITGFELLEKFPNHSFDVIFITAYDHYAIKAIKFSALDYLLKPIDADELKLAVEKFLLKKNNASNKPLYDNLFYNLHQPETDYRLAVATLDGTFFYNPTEIIRCEAVGNYTRLYIKDKKNIIASRTLKEYEDILSDQQFLRVHRTHLVNIQYISSYTRDHELKMKDGSIVTISRRKWDSIKQRLSINPE
jgi:two-component system LytT family response regulator